MNKKISVVFSLLFGTLVNTTYATDIVGEYVYGSNGKLFGKELIETDLKGTWVGMATSLVVENGEVLRTDSAHTVCFVNSNGSYICDGQYSGVDGMLHNMEPWSGQLYSMTTQVYLLVNGDQNRSDAACDLYEVQTNANKDSLNAVLLSTGQCENVPKVFWEMNHFYKISDELDANLLNPILQITEQWVVD